MLLALGTTPTVQRTMVFDRLVPDAVNRAASVIESASGKSINVARTLRTLGHEVLALGFLGGETGRLIRADLDAAAIPHDFVEVGPRTRTCVTVIDRAADQVTELVEETAPVEPAAYERLLATLDANLFRAAALVCSGSLPPGAPPDFYARCTEMANRVAGGVPVILDARGEPLVRALAHRPAVVKPNRQELAETVGFAVETDEQLRAGIRALLSRGPRYAVVTMGAGGAVASDGQSFWRLRPPAVRAVNPIGSGDAFAAGLAAVLAAGLPFPDACRLGTACGTANCLNSPPGHARRADVDRLLAGVGVELM